MKQLGLKNFMYVGSDCIKATSHRSDMKIEIQVNARSIDFEESGSDCRTESLHSVEITPRISCSSDCLFCITCSSGDAGRFTIVVNLPDPDPLRVSLFFGSASLGKLLQSPGFHFWVRIIRA